VTGALLVGTAKADRAPKIERPLDANPAAINLDLNNLLAEQDEGLIAVMPGIVSFRICRVMRPI
jgi:hypothetical protein